MRVNLGQGKNWLHNTTLMMNTKFHSNINVMLSREFGPFKLGPFKL